MEGGMSARRIGLLAGVVTLGASGWYVAVYLARWEWNRALMAGVLFLAAELGLLGLVLVDRLARLERRLDEPRAGVPGVVEPVTASPAGRSAPGGTRPRRTEVIPRTEPDPRVLARVRAAAPPSRRPFAWLDPADRLSVFVPVLLGAGVLLSGVAWLVERIARLAGGATLDRRLAMRLDVLALPPGGLLGDDEPPDPFHPSHPGV
jgi:hypothetical protein